jgi:putative glutamine amidotransferase
MSSAPALARLGIYGTHRPVSQQNRGCALWAAGYDSVIIAGGAAPVPLRVAPARLNEEILDGLDGLVLAESLATTPTQLAAEERMCEWCRERRLPLLAVDEGMHILNRTFGGTLYLDLPKELPTALQHQSLPEEGDRHAINVVPGSRLAEFYGEGEIVVNSEHRRAVCKVGRGFRVSGQALDGVIEAIEAEGDDWFALGVQWHPASASASGLDIQLFRGFGQFCLERRPASFRDCLAAA